MGIDPALIERQLINHRMRRLALARTGLLGVLLVICAVFSQMSLAGHPGAYVCAVDNCKKQYRAKGEQLFEACRDGVAHAVDSGPASAACTKMCRDTYPGVESDPHKACNTGCALFPSRCLRFGKLPPKDKWGRDQFRP